MPIDKGSVSGYTCISIWQAALPGAAYTGFQDQSYPCAVTLASKHRKLAYPISTTLLRGWGQLRGWMHTLLPTPAVQPGQAQNLCSVIECLITGCNTTGIPASVNVLLVTARSLLYANAHP